MHIEIKTRWFLKGREEIELPAELIALLDGIAVGGNLRFAARDARLSYRHAWGMVKTWERVFGHSLVALERGRGATLTEAGEVLRATWQRTHERLSPALLDAQSFAARSLEPLTRAQEEGQLQLAASHGFGVATLAELLRESGVEVELQVLGSEAALARYARGESRTAGFHLPEGELGGRLLARFSPLLDARRDALLLVETRELGFMSRRERPVTGVQDIARRRLRFLNRQPGSGSRLVFDLLLASAGLEAARIPGYHHEEYTHLAVAAVVAAGEADVAFGARAAAERFGLVFHHETTEQYLLVLPRELMHRKPFSLLKTTLASRAYKQRLADIPGADARGSGRVLELRQIAELLRRPARRAATAR